MKKFNVKENIGLIIGLSIGGLAIIASIATYCGIYFSTPNYLLIKNNEFVGDLNNLDDDGNINKDKYYTFSDTDLIKTNKDEDDNVIDIYFESDNFYKANFGYDEFEINVHFKVSATDKGLSGNLSASGEGAILYTINKDGESEDVQKVVYSTYPSINVDFTYKFKTTDDVSRIGFKVDTKIYQDEVEKCGTMIETDSFYFSVLGV